MRKQMTLADFGYPAEGIIEYTTDGGPDGHECPQEALSAHECEYCRKFNHDDWTCSKDGSNKWIDDTCGDIDYIEEWLDSSYGFRYPVRCEYSSDETYEQACKAIDRINAWMRIEDERD